MPSTMSSSKHSGEVVNGNLGYDGRVRIKPTSINYIKPLILAEELKIAHILSIINTKDEWYYSIHPERYVPALREREPETNQDIVVFESTACLQYLAERFGEVSWTGRTAWEMAAVMSWTVYETAGLGTGFTFCKAFPNRQKPEPPMKAVEKLHSNVLKQWDIMNKRLSEPNQLYVALPDRATVADLSYFPFAMPWMFMFLGVDIKDWPYI
ncbi:putative glutathione S-transferase GliG-like protein [Melanomma pulvis-pyrius CBS 109.77]|uniref:glutathione transferase n=1 Tax=Melanomma pulvis-pyrius CBS 109.77 TaxID=1314802 RepID=A0A6A6WWB3_9PLEO|nr:putative glutathione S-transferase GliG-like protein [Melanomma pulvis-pyrius CBS 109.77]